MRDKLVVWLLVGAPGSGKTTFGKTLVEGDPRIVRFCPDEFRAIFGNGEGDQSVSAKAFEATRVALDQALSEHKSVVIDATNMYRKARKQFLDIADKHNAMKSAMVFEVDKSTLIDRNVKRGANGGRNVPENVIDTMLGRYERPATPEFDSVTFVSKMS